MNQTAPKKQKQLNLNKSEKHWLSDSKLNLVIFGLLLLWSFLLGCTYMRSTDIWWHLRTGLEILNRGEIPKTDWFTMTSSERPWIDLHWGFQLLAVAIYKIGDVAGLILLKAFCMTLTVYLGWKASDSQLSLSSLSASGKSLFWIPALICISGRAVVRPEMLTLVFLASIFWILSKAEKRIQFLWFIPLVQLVWLNSHALFILGLIVFVAWVMDQEWKKRLNSQSQTGPKSETNDDPFSSSQLWLPVAAAILVSFMNPYFFQGAFFPFELYKKFSVDQALYSGIGEFQPPYLYVMRSGWGNLYLLSELFLWLVTLLTFIILISNKKFSLFRWILFVSFSFLAWKATRNSSVFAVVIAIIGCQNLSQIFNLENNTVSKTNPKKKKGTVEATSVSKKSLVMVVTLLILNGSIFSGHWKELGNEGKTFSLSEQPEWYVHKAAQFAQKEGMPEEAFVSNIGQAGVYLYHNGPEKKVFMDGRLEVASADTYRVYHTVLEMMKQRNPYWVTRFNDLRSTKKLNPGTEMTVEVTQEKKYPLVLLDSRYSRMQISGMVQMPDWRVVFADGTAAVFLHKTVADRLKLPAVDISAVFYPLDITK